MGGGVEIKNTTPSRNRRNRSKIDNEAHILYMTAHFSSLVKGTSIKKKKSGDVKLFFGRKLPLILKKNFLNIGRQYN